MQRMIYSRCEFLEAPLCVADAQTTYVISGTGDVLELEHDFIAIGSGGGFCWPPTLIY